MDNNVERAAKLDTAAEDRIREAVRGGQRLDEAPAKFKYFALQSKEKS